MNPCAPPIFVARLLAAVRRAPKPNRIIRVGRLMLDLSERTISVGGERVPLTAKEYAIVEILMQRRGMVLTKNQLLSHLYGGMDEPEMKIIDVFVCKLRRKIAHLNDGEHYIATSWGRGYCMQVPVDTVEIDVPSAPRSRHCGARRHTPAGDPGRDGPAAITPAAITPAAITPAGLAPAALSATASMAQAASA